MTTTHRDELIKIWLDVNVHEGEDRSDTYDMSCFSPEELLKLVQDCVDWIEEQV